jgi:hypothetical protein
MSPRRGLLAHDAPLAPAGKPSAAQAAQAGFMRQRDQVPFKQGAKVVVEQVQVFDQAVTGMAAGRRVADQRPHIVQGLGIRLAAFETVARAPPGMQGVFSQGDRGIHPARLAQCHVRSRIRVSP